MNLPASTKDVFDAWVGKIPWKGNGNPLQYSCLGNPLDRGSWWATVYGVAKNGTQLNRHALRNIHEIITN